MKVVFPDGKAFFIVRFGNLIKSFPSEGEALAFAEYVAEHGWNDDWRMGGGTAGP